MPMTTTSRPMISGPMFEDGARLRVSMIAKITITSMAVPMIWSRNAPSWLMGSTLLPYWVAQTIGEERADRLRHPVGQNLGPRESSPYRQGQRHRWVDMGAGDAAGYVHAHHDAEAPRPVDRLGASGERGQHSLSDDTDTEDDQGEGPEQLSGELT